MADKCIGKLTLDISDVEKKVEAINKALGDIGKNANVKISIAEEVKSQIDKIFKELESGSKKITETANKAVQAIEKIGSAKIDRAKENNDLKEGIKLWNEYYRVMAQYERALQKELSDKSDNTDKSDRLKREADAIRERARALVSEADAYEKTATARRAQETAHMDTLYKKESEALKELISLYKQKYELDTKAMSEMLGGNFEKANKYLEEERAIEKEIAAITKLHPELEKTALANEKVAAAQAKWQDQANKMSEASITAPVKEYADALVDLYNKQTNLEKAMASGKVKEGSKEYSRMSKEIQDAANVATEAATRVTDVQKLEAESTKEVADAYKKYQDAVSAKTDADTHRQSLEIIERAKHAYNELTDAIKNYNIAKKSKDDSGMREAQTRIDLANQEVSSIQQVVDSTQLEVNAKHQVEDIIKRCVTAEKQHASEIDVSAKKTNELESQVNGLLTRYLSLMAVIRAISSLMQNMVEYVSEYSQKMNEIQMITMKTDAEVARLADTYRDLAADMSVSSLDMADAAIYFTRQGLGAAEIEKRLKNVTMYAKAANVEFKDASEIITAVVNSMGLVEQEAEDGREAAQRVADVFLNIGDHAATSGQEIGEAMQKAAASAGAFGVSMEWLASYIATVSETTRQEARTIGTAFNTIIARLHQIKQTGYNQEDETKVNDIAKALSKIDVVLMDQAGNWRDMEVILEEIAAKWGELDGKTKSYIATTMAGVKQQNVFLALMNDMSKGVEGNSRAFELHELAVNSDGVATQKYGVYLDSVTASQERLTVAQEKFYALLDSSVIKNWNNMLASIVNWITDATEAMSGLNIIIPLVAGGILLLSAAITKLNLASMTLATLWESHPILLAITGVIALTIAFTGLGAAIASTNEKSRDIVTLFNNASDAIAESQEKIERYLSAQEKAADMFKAVGDKAYLTTEELKEYSSTLDEIAKISPIAENIVNQLREGFITQQEAAEKLNQELERLIENERLVSLTEGIKKYSNYVDSNNNRQSISKMLGWGDSFSLLTNPDYETLFASALSTEAYGYNNAADKAKYQFKYFTEDIFKELQNMQVSMRESGVSATDRNGILADWFWHEMFGTYDRTENPMEALVKQVNDEIDNAIDLISYDLNEVERISAKKMLTDLIFGDDNDLSIDEYGSFSAKIAKFLTDVYRNGFDATNIDQEEAIRYLGTQILGNYFDLMFGDQLEQLKNDPEFDIISTYIIEAISELIEAGFTDVEISNILEGLDLSNWASAVGVMKEKLREEIKKNAGVDGLGISIVDLVTGEETYDQGLWLDLDTTTLKLVNDMVLAGTEFEKIQCIMSQSHTVDEFKTKLAELSEEMGISGEEAEEAAVSFSDIIKAAKAGIKDIQAIDAAIESVKKSLAGEENINYGDIFGLVELHPEIMTVIGDSEKLLETLKKIREEAGKKQEESFVSMLLNTEGVINNTKYADSGFATLGEYRESIKEDEEALKAFDAEILEMANNLQLADENYKQMSKDAKEAKKDATDALKEAQKAFSENIKEVETLDKIIAKLQDGNKVDFSDIINLSSSHPEIVAYAKDADKLIEVLQRLKEEAKGTTKESIKNILYDSEEYFKGTEYYNPESNIKTMREYITSLHESRGDWSTVAKEVDQAAQDIVDAADASSTAAETWLEAQMKIAEINDQVNWAKANNFEDQIKQLQEANERGGIQEAMTLFNSWDDQMQQAIGSTYPAFVLQITKAGKAIKEQGVGVADLTEQTKALGAALSNAQKINSVKYFKDSAKAIKQLSDGTISATDAYDAYTKEVNKVTKAYEDILDVQNKMEYNAKEVNKDNQQAIDAGDVSNLASLLDMTTEEILADFPAAVDMFNQLTGSAGELTDMLRLLNDVAFIRITGTSDADFSAMEAGLIYVQNLADEAVEKLLATGQWEVETIKMNQRAALWNWDNAEKTAGHWTYPETIVGAQVLKPTGKNPFKGNSTVTQKADTKQKSSRSGGGGGGGSSKSNSTPSEIERMLDIMNQVNSIQGGQQSYYQSQQKYYSQTGQLQGVIAYMQREKEVLEEQNPVLEKNIKQIEQYIAQKKAEIATLSTDDEAYKEVSEDLDKLQDAHQKYTKQIVDNKTALEALNQQMDEQRKKIRQMEIDLRNTILGAIEDREKKRTDMLNAEIEMENKILELIKRRYEEERDHILETTRIKVDALNTEKSLLEEQLRIRREEAEAEDKAVKLRELEIKYRRIIADPTRAKEAQSLKAEIDALRKEMAWDISEEEVKSQQESIDQQIESLEDYQEYIENYYEDLFEHPQKLIAEMRQIMMGTQEEIINWLKTNDEEYRNSSENTQESILKGWNETYNEMKGIIQTYWEEVEEIIAQGDDYIIEFLKENSADYAKAGKLQAEAYVEEWKKQLSDLKKAHEAVVADIAASYSTIEKYTGTSGSGSSGGGSKGGSSSSSSTQQGADHYYVFTYISPTGKTYERSDHGYESAEAARTQANKELDSQMNSEINKLQGDPDSSAYWSTQRDKIVDRYRNMKRSLVAYERGGLANYTGPAWVDGSDRDPERILSPYQTKLFETMVAALEQMSKISIPSMPYFEGLQTTGQTGVSVGDIVVNVDNLDTEEDYEEMADKVCEILMDRIGQTAAIGGLRIRSV